MSVKTTFQQPILQIRLETKLNLAFYRIVTPDALSDNSQSAQAHVPPWEMNNVSVKCNLNYLSIYTYQPLLISAGI